MGFINPIWLAGLTALIVPIVIHLLSRKENKKIQLGSLRHLTDATTSKSMNLRLNEWLLLAIRALLITLVVMLLSGFYLSGDENQSRKWVVIEPGLERNPEVIRLTDSLSADGFEARRLSSTFPELGETSSDSVSQYWSLMTSLGNRELEQVVLIASNKFTGFHGKRIDKPSHVSVMVIEPDPSDFELWSAASGDSIITRRAFTDGGRTSFENSLQVATPLLKGSIIADTIRVGIHFDDGSRHDKDLIEASLKAIGNPALVYNVQSYEKNESNNDKLDWLIDLRENAASPDRANHIKLGPMSNDALPVFVPADSCGPGNACWLLTKRLTTDIALQENLPILLSKILSVKQRSAWSDSVWLRDRRVMPERMTWSANRSKAISPSTAQHAGAVPEGILASLILITLALERFVALKRNQ